MLGTWIDGLTDDERDRIVRATQWRDGWFLFEDGARCLVGHVADITLDECLGFEDGWARLKPDVLKGVCAVHSVTTRYQDRFDDLVYRFGLDRIVRAIKVRAGADVESLVREPAGVS